MCPLPGEPLRALPPLAPYSKFSDEGIWAQATDHFVLSLLLYIWCETAHRRQVALGDSQCFLNRGARNENSWSPHSFDISGQCKPHKSQKLKEVGETIPMERYSVSPLNDGLIMILYERDLNKTILLSKHFNYYASGSYLKTRSLSPISLPSPNSASLVQLSHWSHCFPHLSQFLLFYLNMESGNSHWNKTSCFLWPKARKNLSLEGWLQNTQQCFCIMSFLLDFTTWLVTVYDQATRHARM